MRNAFANVVKAICIDKLSVSKKREETYLEKLLVCRIIPFGRNLFLSQRGVGEVLSRLTGKVFMKIAKKI